MADPSPAPQTPAEETARRWLAQFDDGRGCNTAAVDIVPSLLADLDALRQQVTDLTAQCDDEGRLYSRADIGAALVTLTQQNAELRQQVADLTAPIIERYPCQRCGRRDGLDAVMTDAEWERISQGRWNILCLWCMDTLALEEGLSTGVGLYFAGRALHGVMEHAQVEAMMLAVEAARKQERASVEQQLTEAQQEIARLRDEAAKFCEAREEEYDRAEQAEAALAQVTAERDEYKMVAEANGIAKMTYLKELTEARATLEESRAEIARLRADLQEARQCWEHYQERSEKAEADLARVTAEVQRLTEERETRCSKCDQPDVPDAGDVVCVDCPHGRGRAPTPGVNR